MSPRRAPSPALRAWPSPGRASALICHRIRLAALLLGLTLPSIARGEEATTAPPPARGEGTTTAPVPREDAAAPPRAQAYDDSEAVAAAQRKTHEYDDRWGWAVPDFVRLQTGGYLGAISLGVGYSALRDILNLTAAYAFVPGQNAAPHRHMGWAELHVRSPRIAIGPSVYLVPLYLGAGVLIASGKDIFLHEPSVYTAGYYPPTARHWLFSFGLEAGLHGADDALIRRHGLFVEEVTIDQYIDALTQNRETHLLNAFSTSLGYRASF